MVLAEARLVPKDVHSDQDIQLHRKPVQGHPRPMRKHWRCVSRASDLWSLDITVVVDTHDEVVGKLLSSGTRIRCVSYSFVIYDHHQQDYVVHHIYFCTTK